MRYARGGCSAACPVGDGAAVYRSRFLVLQAYLEAGRKSSFLNTAEKKAQVEHLAEVLLALQDSDGLFWAKRDYRVKYLEDNSEVSSTPRSTKTI